MTNLISTDSAKVVIELVSETNDQARWYNIVESVGTGVGAFFVGIGALYTLIPWVDKKRREKKKAEKTKQYRLTYPKNLLNKKFKIVASKTNQGTWYLIDYRSKTKHWIEEMDTVKALGWIGAKKLINQSTLDKYTQAENITILR